MLKLSARILIAGLSAAAGGAIAGGTEMLLLLLGKGDRLVPPYEIFIAFWAYFIHFFLLFLFLAMMHAVFAAGNNGNPSAWKIVAGYFISGIYLALFIYLINYVLNYRSTNPLAASSFVLYFVLFCLVLLFWFLFRMGLLALLSRLSFLRPVFFIVIFIAIALLFAIGLRHPSGRPALPASQFTPELPLPNVIFMVVDTLRADHLSGYGYERPTSKAVDALIQDSVLFERCIAQSSWTRPSTASIMTGLYPGTHLCNKMLSTLPEDIMMIPDAMKQYGYRTALITTNVQISRSFGFGYEVDYYAGPKNQASYLSSLFQVLYLSEKFKKRVLRLDYFPTLTSLYDLILKRDYAQAVISDRADWVHKNLADWLEKEEERPFFAYLHYMEPHTPYDPEPPFDKIFEDPSYNGPILTSPRQGDKVIPPLQKGPPLPAEQLQHMIARYDGEIADFDDRLSILIKGLKARKLYDETMIVLTSDHGEEFYEHGAWTHSHSLYQELIHVPLIIKLPRSRHAGLKIPGQCRTVDIVPTLLDLFRLPLWPGLQGVSLAPVIRNEDVDWEGLPAYSEVTLRGFFLKTFLKGNRKLLLINLDGDHWYFYDLAADPGEKDSLFEMRREEAEEMITGMQSFEQQFSEARFKGHHTKASEKLKENLQALGYLQE